MPDLATADRRQVLMRTLEALERDGARVDPAQLLRTAELLRREAVSQLGDAAGTSDAAFADAALDVVLAAAPICAYANDLDLRYTWVRCDRADFVADEMLGRGDDELLPPAGVAALVAFKRDVLAAGERLSRRIVATVDGAELTYEVTAEPRRDAVGRVVGLLAASLDVTEVMRECRAAQAENLAKDRFLAALSHELRTPLMPVLASAQMLAADAALADGHRDAAQLICRNVEMAARLIDDLLDLTRVAHGKVELRLATVDLHQQVDAVVAMLREEAAAKRLTIRTALDAAGRFVRADAARLQQVIWNLVRNAIKFTPAGGCVDVSTADAPPGRVAVTVADDGVGIDAALLPHVFDAFEQGGRDTTRHFGGLGLGLSIAKAIVELHGGTILARSAGRDAGATFVVELASSDAPPDRARAMTTDVPSAPDDEDASDLAGLSVLIVEDHGDARDVLAFYLRSLGCTVRTAGTCAQALAHARDGRLDFVVSDLGLPDGNGHDLMRQLHEAHGLRGIALSGYGMEADRTRSREAGFSEHLTKPVDIASLTASIRRLVRR